MTRPVRRTRGLAVLATLLSLALGGCVGLPEQGAVRSVTTRDQAEAETLVDYTPGGPKPGSEPVPLVEMFLTAMTATPLNTFVARQFLTSQSRDDWVPERGTLVYRSHRLVSLPRGQVGLQLRGVVELDARGAWLGTTGGGSRDLMLRLVKEGGEWRIRRPPNRLMVPESHFRTEYQQYQLYFFDRSGQVLVPEPVYVPRGPQASTLLVAGLLKGPAPGLLDVERTFLPRGTALDGISVPVSRDGTAEVPLSDDVLDVRDNQLNLMFAQLAWTLGQVTGVARMRVTVDGSPVDLPGARVDAGVGQWSEFDPAVAWASTALFGSRNGRVVAVTGKRETPVDGAFGSQPLRLRSIGVDLSARRVAGATGDGRRVLESDRDRTTSGQASGRGIRTVYEGSDVLRPVYDLYGQIWVVDRTPSGARLWVVRDGVAREVDAPGLTGRPVARFTLSRDGTRLVALLTGGGRDSLLVARVGRDDTGRVRSVGVPVPLSPTAVGSPRIRDLGWRTPSSLALLAAPTDGTSELLVARIDGSSTAEELTGDAELLRDRAVRLVTSPATRAPVYIGTDGGQLFALAGTGRWVGAGLPSGLSAPTFVG